MLVTATLAIVSALTNICIIRPKYHKCLIGEGSPDCSKYETFRKTYAMLLLNVAPLRASDCNFVKRLGENSHISGALSAIMPSVEGHIRFMRLSICLSI